MTYRLKNLLIAISLILPFLLVSSYMLPSIATPFQGEIVQVYSYRQLSIRFLVESLAVVGLYFILQIFRDAFPVRLHYQSLGYKIGLAILGVIWLLVIMENMMYWIALNQN